MRAGEIVCLAGIEGNGQTELVYATDRPWKPVRTGSIRLCGKDITHASIRERSKAGMSHIPEDRHKHGLVLDYTLEENLVLQRYLAAAVPEPRLYPQGRDARLCRAAD